jgi:hypothetical protein
MTTTPLREIWHRAGRAARDDRKRLLALYGVVLTLPALAVGSCLFRLVAGTGPAFAALARPAAYVLDPLRDAWLADDDLLMLLYLLVQGLLLAALWGHVGGAVTRMAAVHVATGRKEKAGAALAFAAGHWRAFAGARAALWGGFLAPIALAVLAAASGRLPGLAGELLLPAGLLVAAALALAAVVVGTVGATAGFLAAPTVACEDSDAFDAVSRVFGYAGAGLPRLLGVRLLFLGGVALGAGWRLTRTLGALVLLALVVRAGVGAEKAESLRGVLAAVGRGRALPDGTGTLDVVAASALALVAGGLLALWVADLVARVLCARVGAYLALRQAIDGVPADSLRTAPAATPPLDAESAGFVEVSRIEDAAPRGRR